ncbi:hypothetical protein ES702_06738 [subsurface metagenome]
MTKPRIKPGPQFKHGGYSLIAKDEVFENNPRIRIYLEECRAGLVRDIAGSEDQLSQQQSILIDRIISKLGICRLIEAYVEKYGILRRDRLKDNQILELEPALGVNYLAFSNSIDRALIALGLNKKKRDGVIDLKQYAKEKYPDPEEKGGK